MTWPPFCTPIHTKGTGRREGHPDHSDIIRHLETYEILPALSNRSRDGRGVSQIQPAEVELVMQEML